MYDEIFFVRHTEESQADFFKQSCLIASVTGVSQLQVLQGCHNCKCCRGVIIASVTGVSQLQVLQGCHNCKCYRGVTIASVTGVSQSSLEMSVQFLSVQKVLSLSKTKDCR